MAVFKCKMCGGDLSVTEGMKVVECDFCGTTQTVPSADNEKKTNLFNRANKLRIAGEFDRASGIYESIIAEFPSEAEAYWGLCLSKYGIEYVDDPRTAEKIPTCHRTSFESIFNDNNYKSALSCADVVARQVYESEARAIDSLQKGILEIVQKEKPFDVFICYKETDEFGSRTQDSVIAQDLYDRLTDKGFKTFFARITLEDKLGRAYEPYIFAALHSAKVMLAIGTKPEYFEAVWVKNEWSRYLDLMNSDKTKLLIPCYRNMDPYDMPDEFRNLQAQDMNKIGFTQDLLRGIGKIVGEPSSETVPAVSNSPANALIQRGYFFLEDRDFKSADEYFDKALDENPIASKAYVGKVLVSFRMVNLSELSKSQINLEGNKNFERAIRFADGSDKEKLEYIKELLAKRVVEKQQREERKRVAKQLSNVIRKIAKKRREAELSEQRAKAIAERYQETEKFWMQIKECTALATVEGYVKAIELIRLAIDLGVDGFKNSLLYDYESQLKILRFLLSDCQEHSYQEIAGQIGVSWNVAIKQVQTMLEAGSIEKGSRVKETYQVIGAIEKRELIERKKSVRRSQGVCQHCGGTLKGLLFKKCTNCGKPKDY